MMKFQLIKNYIYHMAKSTRFSGAEWGDQLIPIHIVGVGGIGSWLTLNLSRIGHELYITDPDRVDETNVSGGQMYRAQDIGRPKVGAVEAICREFGCTNEILASISAFDPKGGTAAVTITGLDNMLTRR